MMYHSKLNETEQRILDRFRAIKPWRKNGKRAPHKPLLILYAIGQFQAGNEILKWNEAELPLKELFFDFGVGIRPKPEYPFIRLANDGVWEHSEIPLNESGDAKLTSLRSMNPTGRFAPDVLKAFINNPDFATDVSSEILNTHFPHTLHSGLESVTRIRRTRTMSQLVRDPNFRSQVLYAYSGKCAVCDYNIGMQGKLVGLEAAHIKWVEHMGPDIIRNGMALCSNHHLLFDNGLWSLTDDFRLRVSPRAEGNGSLFEHLEKYENKAVSVPKGKNRPDSRFMHWQRTEVFKP